MADTEAEEQEVAPTRLSKVSRIILNFFVPVCLFIISLGSFSEAFLLVGDFFTMLQTKLSNIVEYDTLGAIKVGNTKDYIEDNIGPPRVIKLVEKGPNANYYYNEKYLLAIFYKEERVSSYMVVALVDSLKPQLPWDKTKLLGDNVFADFIDVPDQFHAEAAGTNYVYLESVDTGVHGGFLNAYLGSIQYGGGEFNTQMLEELNNASVYGDDEEKFASLAKYRKVAHANFYGQGDISLEQMQEALLTPTELNSYFDVEF